MDTFERVNVSSTKTVHVEKRWALSEFTKEFCGVSLSPELFLEGDPRKKLQLCYFTEAGGYYVTYNFVLRVSIEVSWVCHGYFVVVDSYGGRPSESVIHSSSGGGLVELPFSQGHGSFDFAEIDLTFYLNEPMVEKKLENFIKPNLLPMTCEKVCQKFLLSDPEAPCAFILKVEGKKIAVHGCLLAMHSEVFKRMIEQTGFREGRERFVEITDADLHSVLAMLLFMHGFSFKVRKHAESVLALADKYAVHSLKDFAAAVLKERIGLTTVVHIATVAFLHNVPTLFEECREYIMANLRELSTTAEWKNLCDTNNELLVKLVTNN